MKNKNLIGSCGSLEQMAKLIGKHFFWKEPAILMSNNDDTWSILLPYTVTFISDDCYRAKAGMKFKSVIVRKKKNRIRFERL